MTNDKTKVIHEYTSVNSFIDSTIKLNVDTLIYSNSDAEIEISFEIEEALKIDKTLVLKTNLWHPEYDTCSVINIAKEKKYQAAIQQNKIYGRFSKNLMG